MTRNEIVLKYALSFIGTPYRWGGSDRFTGFDCSGFIQEVLDAVGIDPRGDQTAQGLYNAFSQCEIDHTAPIPECALLFFGKSKSQITHVAMSLGSGSMIEAGGGGSKTVTTADAISQNACIRIKSIYRRNDLVAAAVVL